MMLEKETLIGIGCGLVGGLLAGVFIGLCAPKKVKPACIQKIEEDIERRIDESTAEVATD
jgi:hypothetical protein